MPSIVTGLTDIKMQFGKNKRGSWTLGIFTASDGNEYRSFNEKLINEAKQILASGNAIEIEYSTEPRAYEKRNGERAFAEDRIVKSFAPKKGLISAGQHSGNQPPPEYWEKKQAAEFRRSAHQTALKVCGEIMAACIEAKLETYRYDDAIRVVKHHAKELYASYFHTLEGGSNGSHTPEAANEQAAEVVE